MLSVSFTPPVDKFPHSLRHVDQCDLRPGHSDDQ